MKREKQEEKRNSGEARVTVRVQIIRKTAREALRRDAAWVTACRTLKVEAI